MKTALAPSQIHACQRCGVVRRVYQRRDPRLCRDCKRQEVTAVPADNSWMADGLCRQCDPDLWFPQTINQYDQAAAINICWQCPVRVQCLDHALATDERWGIWGGYTTLERQRIAATRRTA